MPPVSLSAVAEKMSFLKKHPATAPDYNKGAYSDQKE
jgi:hypothetical protein